MGNSTTSGAPPTANATRIKRHRAKAAAMGIEQINVYAPKAVHDVIKQFAERTKSGEQLNDVLNSICSELCLPAFSKNQTNCELIKIGNKVKALAGWRRALAKIAGIL